MLACHVEWHMRERLKPMLFDDDDPTAAARERASIVAPAQPSPAALRKRASKLDADGPGAQLPEACCATLPPAPQRDDTILNEATALPWLPPRPIQARAFALLAVDRPSCSQ